MQAEIDIVGRIDIKGFLCDYLDLAVRAYQVIVFIRTDPAVLKITEHGIISNEPDPAFVIFEDPEHDIVRQSVVSRKDLEFIAVIPRNATVCTDPDVPLLVLVHIVSLRAGKPVSDVEIVKLRLWR